MREFSIGRLGRRVKTDESGLTLMEVVVAIAIMTIIATAAASLSLNGTKTESGEERQQVAVTIANGFMESVSGYSSAVNANTGVSNLYNGRTKSDVQTAFTAYSTLPGVAQTNAVWDTLDTTGQVDQTSPSLPITMSPTSTPKALAAENGTQYTVTTLIGSCYQSTIVESSATLNNCVATSSANTVALIRVIVIVKWTAGSQCVTNGCFYDTSTLIDPNADLEWVTH